MPITYLSMYSAFEIFNTDLYINNIKKVKWNDKIPLLNLNISYEDISGNKYKKTYEVDLSDGFMGVCSTNSPLGFDISENRRVKCRSISCQ